jgi:hypothetical protein
MQHFGDLNDGLVGYHFVTAVVYQFKISKSHSNMSIVLLNL